jgi:hypothetical protein
MNNHCAKTESLAIGIAWSAADPSNFFDLTCDAEKLDLRICSYGKGLRTDVVTGGWLNCLLDP